MQNKNVLFWLVVGVAVFSLVATASIFSSEPRRWFVFGMQIVPLVTLYRHRERLPSEMFLSMLLLYMAIDRVAR